MKLPTSSPSTTPQVTCPASIESQAPRRGLRELPLKSTVSLVVDAIHWASLQHIFYLICLDDIKLCKFFRQSHLEMVLMGSKRNIKIKWHCYFPSSSTTMFRYRRFDVLALSNVDIPSQVLVWFPRKPTDPAHFGRLIKDKNRDRSARRGRWRNALESVIK